jgi:hypothetical protein
MINGLAFRACGVVVDKIVLYCMLFIEDKNICYLLCLNAYFFRVLTVTTNVINNTPGTY